MFLTHKPYRTAVVPNAVLYMLLHHVIQVRDGINEDSRNFYVARGDFEPASPVISTQGQIMITFYTNAAISAQGFTGTYQISPRIKLVTYYS